MAIEKNTKNTLLHEESPFTTLMNDVLNGIRHTGALGLYCYLASKPPTWNICKKELQNQFQCGKDHIETCFRYLRKIGAITVTMLRNEKGQAIAWETTLRRKFRPDLSAEIQNTGNQVSGANIQNTGNPYCGNPAPINNIYYKNNNNNIISDSNESPSNDNFNNQALDEIKDDEGLEGTGFSDKSDYRNNQTKKYSISSIVDTYNSKSSQSIQNLQEKDYEEIVEAYHEVLPDCPRIKVLDRKLKYQLSAMCKQWPKYQKEGKKFSIESFKDYLNYLKQHYAWFVKPYTTESGKVRRNNLRVFTREINITKIVNGEFNAS